MKSAFLLALTLVIAAPAVTVVVAPNSAQAQVLAGSSAARRRTPRQPGLSERDRDRLYEAQDEQVLHETAIQELNAITEGGNVLSEAQVRQRADHQRRLANAQQTVERLEAKRERMGG